MANMTLARLLCFVCQAFLFRFIFAVRFHLDLASTVISLQAGMLGFAKLSDAPEIQIAWYCTAPN